MPLLVGSAFNSQQFTCLRDEVLTMENKDVSGTILAVGAWHEFEQFVESAVSNGWRVLHTLQNNDIATAVKTVTVDFIFLARSCSQSTWEETAKSIWEVNGDPTIVSMRSCKGQEPLLAALTNSNGHLSRRSEPVTVAGSYNRSTSGVGTRCVR